MATCKAFNGKPYRSVLTAAVCFFVSLGTAVAQSVTVASWNMDGCDASAAAGIRAYVEAADAEWFGVSGFLDDFTTAFSSYDGGASGMDGNGIFWQTGDDPAVINDVAFETTVQNRYYHVQSVTLAGVPAVLVQLRLDSASAANRTAQMRQIAADFAHTEHVVLMGDFGAQTMNEYLTLLEGGFRPGNVEGPATTASGYPSDNILVKGFSISGFTVRETDLNAHYAVTCTLTPAADKPYDAEVTYLEAPLLNSNSNVPYINTGLYPGDDMGVLLRLTPLRTADSTACGTQSTTFKWYFGCFNGRCYLSWDTANPDANTRPVVTVGSTYDVSFNYLNSRKRLLTGVGNAMNYSLNITKTWPEAEASLYPIYLFAYNNKGKPGNTGNLRIYFAKFTKGDSTVRSLIPVRKNGGGYMYDRIGGRLLGKVADNSVAEFSCGPDVEASVHSIQGYITLDGDADWTLFGSVDVNSATIIDLNGHTLTVGGISGYGTIMDLSDGEPGELHFNIEEGEDVVSTVALAGNLKVVKEGGGCLALARKGQTFTGGVFVEAGTAYSPVSGANATTYAESLGYWGPMGGTIRVAEGGTFDTKGNYDFHCKDFVLAGGTLANTGVDMNTTTGQGIGNVTLEADSLLNLTHHTAFSSLPSTKIDLGGFTFSVELGSAGGRQLYLPIVVENGTLDFLSGGYLNFVGSTDGGSPTVNLEMHGAAFHGDGRFSVSNYVAAYSQRWNHGASVLKVHGTFTPVTADDGKEYFHGCEMQDGSTIDLSAKTAVWDTVSTGWPVAGYVSDADGSREVTFAEGAKVTIDVHGRTFVMGDRIVSWTEAPPEGVTFAFDAETAEGGLEPFVAANGIYYGADATVVAHAWWTGAVGDGDPANPRNWACTNFMGVAIADGVPGGSSTVHLSGDVNIQIPAGTVMPYDTIECHSARLVADCDWRGLTGFFSAVNTPAADDTDLGSVDLNGHTLRLTAPEESNHLYDSVTWAFTDTSTGDPGELHLTVPLSDSYLECGGFALSGNLKLVKEGEGWLAMTRQNQTFTGGVLVAEGTAYAPLSGSAGTTYAEKYDYWGAMGGTITVASGATFDTRGNYDFYRKRFVLAGGTLANSGCAMTKTTWNGLGNVTLTADSSLVIGSGFHTLFYAPDLPDSTIDLGGYTLSIPLLYGTSLYLPIPIVNGTLDFTGGTGGYLCVESGKAGGSSSLNILMRDSALFVAGELSVWDYVAAYWQKWNRGALPIKVYGTFTPVTAEDGKEYFHGCRMMNGSTIDLSKKEGPWHVLSTGWWSGADPADGNRMVEFEDGATVNVEVGGRSLGANESIIDWTDMAPGNLDTLAFRGVSNGVFKCGFLKTETGLFPVLGTMIIVR